MSTLKLNIKKQYDSMIFLYPCLRRFCALGVTQGERKCYLAINSGIPSTTIRLRGEIFFDTVATSLK